MALRYLPEAIPTTMGWAHPLTGERIDVSHGLADPIAYYKPNSGARSFIDPDGDTSPLAFAVVTGRRARMIVHTLDKPAKVEWDFGDGSDTVTSSVRAQHIYAPQAENETYTVTATLFDADDEGTPVQFEVTIPGTNPSPGGE